MVSLVWVIPENEAERKRLEASGLKDLNQLTKRSWEELVEQLPTDTFTKLLQRKIVMNAIITNGTNEEFIRFLKAKIGKSENEKAGGTLSRWFLHISLSLQI